MIKLIRDVTIEECGWLERDFKNGDIVYKFNGATYNCISENGIACSEKLNENPFFELPLDSIEEII